MAVSSCLGRSRSGVIPLAIRSLGSNLRAVFSVDDLNRSGLPAVQLLPCRQFSTNLLTKAINLTDNLRTCSHVVAPIPSDLPFEVQLYLSTEMLSLHRMYQEEFVDINVGDLKRDNAGHPFIPLKVFIFKGNMKLHSDIILMPNRIQILELTIRGANEDTLKEYLETKQIISSKMLRLLYHRLEGLRRFD